MKYDGFSDEVVTDGTQNFGRGAGDGLLSIGYAATKRLILADRHGDVIGGFDPADTTLSAGLPDSRSFDPFGKSTAASGTTYRVGYQGDWTDPNNGDVNQGARWYDPDSGTFNSRDTMSYAAGVASSLPNLYAYATGNPVTFNDPTGNSPFDPPDSPNTLCTKVANGDGHTWVCPPDAPKPPKPPTKCVKDCNKPPTKCVKNCNKPPGDGCKKDCGGDGGGGGHNSCATKSCKTPPPPPKCDTECQRQKKLKDQEDKAQKNPIDPPGKPTCSGGNPALCSSRPDKPSDTFGGYEDKTDETDSYTDTIYQNTVDQVGKVVGSVTQTGAFSMLQTSGMMFPGQISPCSFGACSGGFATGGSGIAIGGKIAGLAVGGSAGIGVLLMNDQSGGGNFYDNLLRGGGTAQPPDDDDYHYGGGRDIDDWTAARSPRGGSDHVVLGKSRGLPAQAAKIGGRHLMNSGEWQQEVVMAANNPSTKISVVLDGVNGSSPYTQVMNSVQKAASGANATPFDWEMSQLYSANRLEDVDFYLNGGKIANPFR